MDHDPPEPSAAVERELIDLSLGSSPDVGPVLIKSVPRLRSPIVSRRSSEPAPVYGPGHPSLDLPPMAALRRPVVLALLAAAPAFMLVGWQFAVAVCAGAVVIRQIDKRVRRVPFEFADGFLPYRSQEGWPRGVQEDDDVRWNWAPVRNGHAAGS